MAEPSGWGPWGPLAPPPGTPAGPGRQLPAIGFGAILETTVRLTRRHPRPLVILALLFLLPAWLLNAAAGTVLVEAVLAALPSPPVTEPVTFSPEASARIGNAALWALGTSLLVGLAGALGGVGFSRVVECDYHGVRPSVTDAGRLALRRAPAVLGLMLLSTLAFAALLLGGIMLGSLVAVLGGSSPGGGGLGVFLALIVGVAVVGAVIVLSIRWSLGVIVLALEGAGPIRALVRSWRLTAGAAWRTLGVIVIVSLVVAVVGGLLSEILGLAMADLLFGSGEGGALLVRTVISAIISVMVAPIVPMALTVLYYDQRVRRESFDLGGGSPPP